MVSENEIVKILEKYDKSRQNILYILKEIQSKDTYNQIKEEYSKVVCREVGISLSEIYEIITFYSMLSANKQGENIIEVCTSGPCYVRKSKLIVDHLKRILEINIGETTSDYKFTLKSCSCIGECDNSPVIRVNGVVYKNITTKKIDEIINRLTE